MRIIRLFPVFQHQPLTRPEYPWPNNASRRISGCIIDARWAPGSIIHTKDPPVRPSFEKGKTRSDYLVNIFKPSPKSNWVRINISSEVFKAINFKLPDSLGPPVFNLTLPQSRNASALEALVLAHIHRENGAFNDMLSRHVEHTLATVFADSLARLGSWRTPQNRTHGRILGWEKEILRGYESGWAYEKPAAERAGEITVFHMRQLITGCKHTPIFHICTFPANLTYSRFSRRIQSKRTLRLARHSRRLHPPPPRPRAHHRASVLEERELRVLGHVAGIACVDAAVHACD